MTDPAAYGTPPETPMDDQTAKKPPAQTRIQRRVTRPLLIRLYENERDALDLVAKAYGLTLNRTVAAMLRAALELYNDGLLPEKKKRDDESLF